MVQGLATAIIAIVIFSKMNQISPSGGILAIHFSRKSRALTASGFDISLGRIVGVPPLGGIFKSRLKAGLQHVFQVDTRGSGALGVDDFAKWRVQDA